MTADGLKYVAAKRRGAVDALIAEGEARAAQALEDGVPCKTCGRLMLCGQERSNLGHHYTCTEGQ